MEDLWKQRRHAHKKVDFEDRTYNRVQDLCFELFGKYDVVPCLEYYCIYIIHPRMLLTLCFSSNETKVYVYTHVDVNHLNGTCYDPKVRQFFWNNQSVLRVLCYESMERYLRLKAQELELIKEIDE